MDSFLFFFVGWMNEGQPGVIFKKNMHTEGRNNVAIELLGCVLGSQIIEHY